MSFAEIGSLSIFYAGLCAGLALFALILDFQFSRNLWAFCKTRLLLGVKWFLREDHWMLLFGLVGCGTLLMIGLLFPETPKPILPEPPEIGRYLLADGLDRIAEFHSQSDCQFAKNSIWAHPQSGRNLGARLICVYLGKGEAASQSAIPLPPRPSSSSAISQNQERRFNQNTATTQQGSNEGLAALQKSSEILDRSQQNRDY